MYMKDVVCKWTVKIIEGSAWRKQFIQIQRNQFLVFLNSMVLVAKKIHTILNPGTKFSYTECF